MDLFISRECTLVATSNMRLTPKYVFKTICHENDCIIGLSLKKLNPPIYPKFSFQAVGLNQQLCLRDNVECSS